KLKAGVRYDFKLDANGKRIGVELDREGRPIVEHIYDRLGRDPNRPQEEAGSVIEAIHNRKLYFSGLGGRLIDDKRIFEVVSKNLAPEYHNSKVPIASPPRTLDPSE